ncbi:malignant fibrous histiocytoma-amplified sequence 1 homolog [Glandiceps talaboti]
MATEDNELCHIDGITKMVTCDLSYKELSKFPPELYRQSGVQVLYLTGNKLKNVPNWVGWVDRLDTLEELYLDDNLLEEFPLSVCNLKRLRVLNLNGNTLNNVPSEIAKLKDLKRLALARNEFDHFPEHVLSLRNLEYLFLGDNKIESISLNIGKLIHLKELWINNNKISKFPNAICELSNLKHLWAYRNEIRRLPSMFARRLSKLESLRVYGNPLVEPPYEVVNLGIGAIKKYEEEIERTAGVREPRLKMVVLGEAKAGKTSLISTMLSNKSRLTGEEDRTHCIDVLKWFTEKGLRFEIYDFGGHQAYSVTHQFFLTPHSLNVLVFDLHKYTGDLFDTMIGYWLNVLQSRVPGAIVCLVGSHVDLCKPKEIKSKCQDVMERVAKMKQQQILDIQAQMKVLDTALKENSGTGASHRLPGVSIDTLRKRKVHLEFLLQNRLQITHKLHTISSAWSMEGIDNFRKCILKLADDVNNFPDLQRVLPSTWSKLEKAFLRDNGNFGYSMPWKQCVAMGEECGLDEGRLQSAIYYLHKLGSVLHFEHIQELRKFVFPNPVRLIDIFKDMFHHDLEALLSYRGTAFRTQYTKVKFRQVKADLMQRGLMSFKLIGILTSDHLKTDSEVQLILQLMEKFGICFPLPQMSDDNENTENKMYRFPWYLRDKKPSDVSAWPVEISSDTEQISIGCEIQGFCPSGIFERLCVLVNRHISPSYREDWSDGVCGYSYDGLATFLLDYRSEDIATELGVSARGTMATVRSMWKVIMAIFEELRQLMKEWPGILHDEFIVCPHCVKGQLTDPEVFPGEFLNQPRPRDVIRVPCPSGRGTMDAGLVYPPPLDEDPSPITGAVVLPSSGTVNRADVRGSGAYVIQTGPQSTVNVGYSM